MIGKKISHYQVVEKLGEGGMGVVYKAEDTKLQRTVALKFLPADAVGSDDERDRFISEARAAAALDHPNICTIYEINEAEGQNYIAMAYVEGLSLKEKIEDRPLKIEETLKIGVQVAKGLNAAHQKGIVHRDIKSANIMVTPEGRAKIMDFGLAARSEAPAGGEEGSTLGTIAYSSPEQIGGSPMDQRTDIWSFGITLYEMVTGRLPFHGDYEQAIVYSILNEHPEPVTGMRTGVPVELERIINKALAKNLDDRYQHVEDMLYDLKSLQNELDPNRSRTGGSTGTRPVYVQDVSLFRKMLDRHVFQVLAVYVAIIWGATRGMAWIVDQFVLSPHWVNITTLALVALLPTVFLLSFFRGARAQSQWTRSEKIGIPVNLLLVIALLALVFQGKDIGAATTKVAVENEDGETIERVIPKSEFRKRLAVYLFENASGDSTTNWLASTTTLLLEYDLIQDQFLDIGSAFDMGSFADLQSAGFNSWQDAPVALKRKIARESHHDYFLEGSIRLENGRYYANTRVHSIKSEKSIAEFSIDNPNLFSLIDEMSVQIKRDMGVPAGYLEETTDLALEEMLTSSVEAVKHMGLAREAAIFNQDWQQGIEHLKVAIALDSTLAHTYFTLAQFYVQANQSDKSNEAYEAAMRYVYKMPERMQFILKANYYFLKQQPDKAFNVLIMMTELYPSDTFGHTGLAQIYMYRNEIEMAIREYKILLELAPEQHDYLHTIGDLYRQMGDTDAALDYYEQYADLNPKNPDSFTRLGRHYEHIGDYENASTNYEKALLLDPGLVPVMIDLADIENTLGRSEAALEQYQTALQKSRSASDRIRVRQSMKQYFIKHGQINRAIEYLRLAQEEEAATLTPLMAQMRRTSNLELYVLAGREDEAFAILEDIETKVSPPFDKVIGIGTFLVYAELGRVEEARAGRDRFEEYISAFKVEMLRQAIFEMNARIAELNGEYEEAISNYKQQLVLAPSERLVPRYIGRCYRELGQNDKAEEQLQIVLAFSPFDPETNYELALVYHATGDGSKAKEHLDRALKIWENADEVYQPAIDARKTREQWKSDSS